MMKNHLQYSAAMVLLLLWPWMVLTAPHQTGQAHACLHCPAGHEPSTVCNEVTGPDAVVECRRCPPGTFSDSYSPDQCTTHTQCMALNRRLVTPGNVKVDALCGACLPGFNQAPSGGNSATLHSCMKTSLVRSRRNAGKGARASGAASSQTGVGGDNSTAVHAAEDKITEYAVFALVPVFGVMGLVGIFICNMLKKKGYKCTAEKENVKTEPVVLQKEGNPCPYVIEDQNEDTISALVRLITEKKENAAALEELLREYEKKQTPSSSKRSSIKFPGFLQFRSMPRVCPHRHHLHTINGLAPLTGIGCSRCSQKKWPQVLSPLAINPNKTPCLASIPSSPGESRVHNVGRFQVAQILEGQKVSVVTTPAESNDTNSIKSTNVEPAEELSLLGVSSSTSPPFSKSRKNMNE